MALSPELLQYKSSGVYRLEFDRSQTANVPAETIRLVIGYSNKGPFNTPVFINDASFFQEVYGGIDRSLERKGSYFHRSCLTCLERGPILALNLLRLNNDPESPTADTVKYQAFSTSATLVNPVKKDALYSGFYNKDKFWYPEAETTLRTLGDDSEVFQLVNLKQKPITVLVRKAINLKGFDILAKEWYGVENVPDFMDEFDYISDFFIEVIVLDGDYTNYENLAIDPIFGKYFHHTKGIIKSTLEMFLNLPQVNVLARYTGTLIPDFIDHNGNNMFIQDLINFETSKTGLFCAINKELFDSGEKLSGVKEITYNDNLYSGIDIIGHNIYNYMQDNSEFDSDYLSYKQKLQTDDEYFSNILIIEELKDNQVIISDEYKDKVFVGNYLVADKTGPNGESRLTKINRISKLEDKLIIITDEKIKIQDTNDEEFVVYCKSIDSSVDAYNLFTLNGFNLRNDYHVPNGTEDRINEILDETIGPETNLYKALIDKEAVTYRYIIDTFGKGINVESKKHFSLLAKNRQNALAIANAPSMEDFKKSFDPKFVDSNGALNTYYISTGGDLSLNPQMIYSLPSLQNGSNYIAFYAPYITVKDRGKNINVPPAAYVSNNFISKYTNALPWSIVAGPRRGVISGRGVIGLETNFDRNDRDNLEPFGINPIVFQRGVGLQIAGNKTAQQSTQSALSSVHVREVLIYIEDGIAEILKNYHFEFNTPQTRLEIKTLADNFLESIRIDNGIYDFKNVIDTSNNTSEVIDANIGILDTYVEPVKGLEILVHRTTVLKTGAIQTGQYL